MRFRYSFQKIVDLKANEKTQAEWVLSGAVGRLREEEESLSTLYVEKNQIETQLSSASQMTTASELMVYQNYLDHLDNRIGTKRWMYAMPKTMSARSASFCPPRWWRKRYGIRRGTKRTSFIRRLCSKKSRTCWTKWRRCVTKPSSDACRKAVKKEVLQDGDGGGKADV
jgi:hypothetical protein